MKHTRESVLAVLKEIQNRVPKIIRDRIVEKAELTPTIKKIATEALNSGSTKEELKIKLRGLIESGQLDKVKYVENPKYAKMATDFVKREIAKAVRLGKLPRKVDLDNLK